MEKAPKKEIYLTDKARIVEVEPGNYEVSHVLRTRRGELIEPKDEDFGVFAWSVYTYERAFMMAVAIEQGRKPIVPMGAQE